MTTSSNHMLRMSTKDPIKGPLAGHRTQYDTKQGIPVGHLEQMVNDDAIYIDPSPGMIFVNLVGELYSVDASGVQHSLNLKLPGHHDGGELQPTTTEKKT